MSVLDAARLRLRIAAGQWPPAPKSGVPTYPARLQKLLDAGQVVACQWCGGPHPGTTPGDWSACEDCQLGAEAYGSRWPLAAALLRLRVDAAVRERALARRNLLVDTLPAYGDLPGAQPSRPVAPWSHLRLPVPEDKLAPHGGEPLLSGLTVRTDVRVGRAGPVGRFHVEPLPGHDYPTWRTVVAAAVAEARAEVDAREVSGPPNGDPGCAWCGVGSAPRQEWQTVDGRPWCGQVNDCPLPVHGSPVRDRAQCVAAILDEAYDPGVVDRAHRAGRLPVVRFQDHPDDERARGGWTAPFGWLSDEDVDGLRALLDDVGRPNDEHVQDALTRGRADAEFADRARTAEEARQAETIARAEAAARKVARDEARPTWQPPSEEETQAIVKKATRDVLIEHARRYGPERVDALGQPIPRGRGRTRR